MRSPNTVHRSSGRGIKTCQNKSPKVCRETTSDSDNDTIPRLKPGQALLIPCSEASIALCDTFIGGFGEYRLFTGEVFNGCVIPLGQYRSLIGMFQEVGAGCFEKGRIGPASNDHDLTAIPYVSDRQHLKPVRLNFLPEIRGI